MKAHATPLMLAACAAVVMSCAAQAKDDDARPSEDARKAMEQARQEVEKARAELARATRELAKSMAKAERNNPKAQYFEYITDPKRAMLGVIIDDDAADKDAKRGVRILAVTPGGGAEKAGLKAGDLVTAIDGKPLAGSGPSCAGAMRDAMRSHKAGDEIKVDVERAGAKKSFAVVSTHPDDDMAMMPMVQDLPDLADLPIMPMMPLMHFRGVAVRGLELAKLDDDMAWYFKTKDGVLVIKAPKNGPIAFKSGDVITKIDGDAVTEPVTVLDKLRGRGEERAVKIEVQRQGKKVDLDGKIPVAVGPQVYKHKRIVIDRDRDEDEDHDEEAGSR